MSYNIIDEFNNFTNNLDNTISDCSIKTSTSNNNTNNNNDISNCNNNNNSNNNNNNTDNNNNNNNNSNNNNYNIYDNNLIANLDILNSNNIYTNTLIDNSKLIIINSKNRNNIKYPLSNNYKINCNLQNVKYLKIISHNINISHSYLINEYNNKVLVNDSYIILNYQNKFNIMEFQYKLRKITKGNENCFIDPTINKFNIFDCSKNLTIKFQEYNSSSLASILGFNVDKEYKEHNGKIFGSYAVNFNKDNMALLYLNNYKNLDIIDFNSKNNYFHLISQENFYKGYKFNKPENIDNFDIKIFDINGNLMNLNNFEYFIELLVLFY